MKLAPCQIEFMLKSPQNVLVTFEFAGLNQLKFLSVLSKSGLTKIYKNTYKKYVIPTIIRYMDLQYILQQTLFNNLIKNKIRLDGLHRHSGQILIT